MVNESEDEECVNADKGHPFDQVIKVVGEDGRFQKRFNIWYNLIFAFLVSMPALNIIIALAIPNHWCAVPGKELTNFTGEEWKSHTIPRDSNAQGESLYKHCKMFNISLEDLGRENLNNTTYQEIDCQHGWEYDTTWYQSTAPSDEDWVCHKDTYVANIFAITRIGEGLGSLLFGHLSDIFGRRPILYTTIVICTFGRSLSAFTASNYLLFAIVTLIGSLPTNSIATTPMVIGFEICKSEDRAHIAMLQTIGWTFSASFMPLILWAVQDWSLFMLLSTLPCLVYLFLDRFVVESPRWLVSAGKTARALKELEKIAKVNGTRVPDDAALLLRKPPGHKKKFYGVMSLFSHWRLAKNTALLATSWIITIQIYSTMILNVNNLGGNPYLLYFLQGIAELPASIFGNYSTNKIGRRWTNILAYLVTSLGCIPLMFIIDDPEQGILTGCFAFLTKFSISITLFSLCLQAMETYPTCVRQTGSSFNTIMASIFDVLSPYIVYWGATENTKVPYIVASVLSIIAAFCGLFLPETLNKELPETLEDGRDFGAEQTFWNFPWEKKSDDRTYQKP